MMRNSTAPSVAASPQYESLRTSVIDWEATRESKLNGPVPLGAVFSASSVSSDESMARFTEASPAASAASGADKVSTTVAASGASMALTLASVLLATAAVASSWMRSSEVITSSESNELPSAKTTSGRKLIVRLSPSSATSQDSASPGTTSRSWSNSVSVP